MVFQKAEHHFHNHRILPLPLNNQGIHASPYQEHYMYKYNRHYSQYHIRQLQIHEVFQQ